MIVKVQDMVESVGIPTKLLHETRGLIVTVEVQTGEMYRGHLHEIEDNMNVELRGVTATARNGSVSLMESVFLRGSNIRLFVIPDNMRHALFFNRNTSSRRMLGLGLPKSGPEIHKQ